MPSFGVADRMCVEAYHGDWSSIPFLEALPLFKKLGRCVALPVMRGVCGQISTMVYVPKNIRYADSRVVSKFEECDKRFGIF